MKKILMLCGLCTIAITSLQAQAPNRQGGGGRGLEMMKQRMKDELKLTDVQADSVMAIQNEFQAKNRELRTNETMSESGKKETTKANNEARKARIKNNLSDDQIKKLEEWNENMRKMRENRQNNRK